MSDLPAGPVIVNVVKLPKDPAAPCPNSRARPAAPRPEASPTGIETLTTPACCPCNRRAVYPGRDQLNGAAGVGLITGTGQQRRAEYGRSCVSQSRCGFRAWNDNQRGV